MILVKTNNKELILECDSGIAGDVLYTLSPYNPTYKGEDRVEICVSMDYINQINRDLAKYKGQLKLDSSFLEWKDKYAGKTPLLIRAGVTFSKIYRSPNYDIPHKDIEDVCKYFFKPAVNQKAYKDKKWDGYIHLYKRWIHQFPTGLLDRVCKVLDEKQIAYRIEYAYDTSPAKQFNWEPKDIFTLSEDQVECINECMQAKRCVVKAATGFGKTSALARYLTAYHGVPTLFIANKKVLLDDAAKDFVGGIDGLDESGVAQIKDGWFGDINLRKTMSFTEEDLWNAFNGKGVVVATIQSLNARLEDPRTKGPLLRWLQNTCQFLMVDETQAVGTKVWDDVLEKINAPYRVFLSATPKRVDGATLKIFAYAGPLVFDTSADEQIAKGRLCELDIQYWPFDHKLYNDNDTELVYNEVYTSSIVQNEERNRFIVERCLEMLDEERQVLILIQFIEHGYILKDLLLSKGLEVDEIEFIYGETSDKKRQEAINGFRKGDFKVLIGSTVADAGLNIPSISGVILCGAGNSDITHIQRIGRGSRTFDYKSNWGFEPKFLQASAGKKITKIIDILDTNVAFFKKQAKNRYYNASQEFGADRVHIVGADQSIFRHRAKKKDSLKDVDTDKALNEMFGAFKNIDREKIDNAEIETDNKVSDFLKAFRR